MFWPYMNSKITWLCSFIFTLVTVVSHTFMYHFNMASRSPWCCIFNFTLVTIILEFLLDNTHVILKTSLIRNCLPTKITIVDNHLVLYFHMITKFILTCIHSVTDLHSNFSILFLLWLVFWSSVIFALVQNITLKLSYKPKHTTHIFTCLRSFHSTWNYDLDPSFITSSEVSVTSYRCETSLRI